MCLFGGGSSAPTRDLEAEAAQEAERERQETEKTKLKTQQTESQVKKISTFGAVYTITITTKNGKARRRKR